MAVRKLPSGKWQAQVYKPDGKRTSGGKTFTLKKQAEAYEAELKAKFARGDTYDPRAGQILVGAWFERWFAVHGVLPGTKAKIASLWRVHCEPKWAHWPMASITRMDVKGWIAELEAKPTIGAATAHEAINVMGSMYRAAVTNLPAPIVTYNPFAGFKREELPTKPPAPSDFYTEAEALALVAELERWPAYAAMVELGMWTGLRSGEMRGLHGIRVNWLTRTGASSSAEVTHVMTRYGLREYPKTRKSHRSVPVRGVTMDRLRELVKGRPLDEPVLLTPTKGRLITDTHFLHKVWDPAVKRAGIRRFPPKVMRHTAASWLVQSGVSLYDVQHLLGHEKSSTTERYSHLRPGAHGAVLDAWGETG